MPDNGDNINANDQTTATTDDVQEALKRLDNQYATLQRNEGTIRKALQRLQEEETVLTNALQQATMGRQAPSKQQEAEAVLRLQQALMGNSSSEDDAEDEQSKMQAISVDRDESERL